MDGFSFPFGDEKGFESEGEQRAAWRQHRGLLMSQAEPGTRPAAFWRYDIGLDDFMPHWDQQLNMLMSRNLVAEEEAQRVEHLRETLSPGQSELFCSSFESAAGINMQKLGNSVLRRLAAEFETAARWHDWRGRPEMAARYELRARTIAAVISGGAA